MPGQYRALELVVLFILATVAVLLLSLADAQTTGFGLSTASAASETMLERTPNLPTARSRWLSQAVSNTVSIIRTDEISNTSHLLLSLPEAASSGQRDCSQVTLKQPDVVSPRGQLETIAPEFIVNYDAQDAQNIELTVRVHESGQIYPSFEVVTRFPNPLTFQWSWIWEANFKSNTEYFWHAYYSCKSSGEMGPSATGTIVTGSGENLPPAPKLVYPEDGAILDDGVIVFGWEPNDAINYVFEFTTIEDVWFSLWSDSVSEFDRIEFITLDTYRWRISALNQYGIGDPSPPNTFTLVEKVPRYSLSGVVTGVGGKPVGDVAVTATHSDGTSYTSTSSENGKYTLENLPAGTYTVQPSRGGYTIAPNSRTVTVPPDANGKDFSAFDRAPIVFVHGWHGWPPWGSCEWPDPYDDFLKVNIELAKYYHIEYATLETSPCYTPSITANVERLRNAIRLAKGKTGQPQVILIAHSMGGLVSRAYIEGPDYSDDVSMLFTLGSPHLGVPDDLLVFLFNGITIGELCKFQTAACDFTILGMSIFNATYQKNDEVEYHLITGVSPFLSRTAFGMATWPFVLHPDDGIVPKDSGVGLRGTMDRYVTDEAHNTDLGSHSYFVRDDGESTSFQNCLKPVLIDRFFSNCGTVGSSQREWDAVAPSVRTPLKSGDLRSGQTVTHSLSVEETSALFVSGWQTGTMSLSLIDPHGLNINPTFAAAHPELVLYAAYDLGASYYFTTTIPGVWTGVVSAENVSGEGSHYTTFASFDSPIQLTANSSRNWYFPGSKGTITASLPAQVTASVTASIQYANGAVSILPLTLETTGLYTVEFAVPELSGYAQVDVVAVGTTDDGTTFERGTSLIFQVTSSEFALDGSYHDFPDRVSPNSSYYKALTVTVGVKAWIDEQLVIC